MTEVSPADSPVEEEAGEFVESGEDEPSFPRPLPLALHDIVVVDSAGQIDFESRVVSFQPTSPEASAQPIIVVVSVEGKFLVAVPGVSWSKAVRDRRLPSQSLTKVFSAQVLASSEDSRDQPSDGVYIKVWFGLLKPEFEQCLDLSGAGIPHPAFPTVQSEEGFLPFAQSLVTVADEKYSFFSADSGPPVPSSQKRNPVELESRVLNIEASIQEIASSLQVLMSGGQPSVSSPSKPAHVPRPPALRTQKFPGLDQGVVNAALQSGIDSSQLAQLSQMLGGRKPHLKDVPPEKQKPRVTFDILGEPVTSEPEESGVADSLQPAVMPQDPVSAALVKLTSIVDSLANKRKSVSQLSELSDDYLVLGEHSASSSTGGNRKHALILSSLRRALQESPEDISAVIENRMEKDVGSQASAPGIGSPSASFRGWAEHRSRLQNINTTVRVMWSVCGALDCLRAGRESEARARLCLLVAQLDQLAIDRGQWVLSAEGALEDCSSLCQFRPSTASRMHWNPSTRSFGPLPGRRL